MSGLARPAEEGDAVDLDEAHRGERAGERQRAANSGSRLRTTPFCRTGACSAVWNVSHSETKPFSGGSAEMASAPMRK